MHGCAGLTHHTARLNGIKQHWISAGQGPPVYLLHGFPETSYAWRKQIPALAGSYTVVAPDLRGYGDTDKPAEGYDKRTMAADLAALMDHLGHRRAAVVGHDRGTRVATRFAKDHPQRLDRLCVMDNVPTLTLAREISLPLAQLGWFFTFLGVPTVSAARDFDAVRRALGERRVSWLGLSYGTLLTATYARLYPHHVRAAVLDGSLDHTIGSRRLAADEAASAEEVFGQFAEWCRSDASCALYGRDVRAEYRALLDRAPLPAAASGTEVTADQLGFGTYAKLIFRSSWSRLAQDLADARTDASAFAAVGAQSAAYRVITCHDMPTGDLGYEEFRARLAEVRRLAPTVQGHIESWDVQAGCLGWPVRPANAWGPIRVSGTPPLLVVAGTHDPATPLSWGRGMASQIEGARLLTWDGAGHTAFLNDTATLGREAEYLITGRP